MLINKVRCCWIEDAIDNNFVPLEARMIKSIPLCFTDAEDKLYWPSMMDGAYSIKASYRFLIDNEMISNVSPLALSHPKSTWKGLWKLRIPNRTKTLMWRAISNALPQPESTWLREKSFLMLPASFAARTEVYIACPLVMPKAE